MIFYFSGTGNSHWVAKQIGLAFNDQIISIADELNTTNGLLRYTLKEKAFHLTTVVRQLSRPSYICHLHLWRQLWIYRPNAEKGFVKTGTPAD